MADGAIVITLPADMDPAQRNDILDALDQSGAAIQVDLAAGQPDAGMGDMGMAGMVEFKLGEAVDAASGLPAAIGRWWDAFLAANDGAGLVGLLLVALVLAGAYALERAVMAPASRWFSPASTADALFSVRLRAALKWLAGRALGLLLFYVFARIGANLALPDAPAVTRLAAAVGWAIFNARVFFIVTEFLTGAGDRRRRMVPLSDEDGAFILRASALVLTLLAVANAAVTLLLGIGAGAAAQLPVLATATAVLILVFSYFVTIRRPVAALIREVFQNPDGSLPRGVAMFAGGWHILYGLLSLLNNATRVSSVLMDSGAGMSQSANYSFLILILTPFLIGACDALFAEWTVRLRAEDQKAREAAREAAAETAREAAARHAEAVAKAEAESAPPPPAPAAIEFAYESNVADRIGVAAAMKALGHGAILIGSTTLVLLAWHIDPFTRAGEGFVGKVVPSLVSVMAVLVVGWSIWEGVAALIDWKNPKKAAAEDGSGEGMGKQGSRLETVLPVIRMVAMAVIWTVAIMTALTAMGVNIGPLLAGAGVIGLAVGFGAQTLVKDVISGALYLYEDAFRVGEYITAGPGKGVVEHISLRSVRLRHHRGPLFTIPFSNLGTIQNHSRDWVKVKFELHVPHDTDVEKVRKLIKKIGEAMLENEQYGRYIIEPVKSQGVVRVDDLGFVIGVKFMAKPGQQFLIRRDAYLRIKQAFTENGIEFSTPRVLVDSGDGEARSAEKAAIASAAAAARAAEDQRKLDSAGDAPSP